MHTYILLLVAVLFFPSVAFGFSAGGHRVIAEIAWQNMSEEARLETYRVLQKHPRLQQDLLSEMPNDVRRAKDTAKARWLFQQASRWPDIARSIAPNEERRKYHHSPWHYINFPTYLDKSHEGRINLELVNQKTKRFGNYGGWANFNVIQALKDNVAGYQDVTRTDQQRAVNLCWVLHLVADSHQPLHATAMFTPKALPNGCRGGNLIKVTTGGNLHSLWDRLLGSDAKPNEVASRANRYVKEFGRVAKESTKQTDICEWLRESQRYAAEYAYTHELRLLIEDMDNRGLAVDDDNELTFTPSENYRKTAGRLAQRRAVEAGLRTAEILNRQMPEPPKLIPELQELSWLIGRFRICPIRRGTWDVALAVTANRDGDRMILDYRMIHRTGDPDATVSEELYWDSDAMAIRSKYNVKPSLGSKATNSREVYGPLFGVGSYTLRRKSDHVWIGEGKFSGIKDDGEMKFNLTRLVNGEPVFRCRDLVFIRERLP